VVLVWLTPNTVAKALSNPKVLLRKSLQLVDGFGIAQISEATSAPKKSYKDNTNKNIFLSRVL